MEQKRKYIEVAGALLPANPKAIAKWINDRHPKIDDEIVRPYEVDRAFGNEIEIYETPEGDMVATEQLWTFVDTHADTQGYMELADIDAYKRKYGEVTGDTYDKHKKLIQRTTNHPKCAMHRPFSTSKSITTANSFGYYLDEIHFSKPRYDERTKLDIIRYVNDFCLNGMSAKKSVGEAARHFKIPASTIEKWVYS